MAFKWDTDRVISICAMVVGVGSLFTIGYQATLTRQMQHASVLPYLYISISATEQQGVRPLLSNSGIGPALVDEVHIRYQGRDFTSDPFDFILVQRPDMANGARRRQSADRPSDSGGRDDSDGRIRYQRTKAAARRAAAVEIAEVPRAWYTTFGAVGGEKAVIEITYKSVYGDRWRVRSDRIVPEKL